MKKYALAAFAAALCVATLTFVLPGGGSRVDTTASVSLLLERCASDTGMSAKCVSEGMPEIVPSGGDLAAFAGELVRRIGDDEVLIRSCHTVMHAVGAYEPSRMLADGPTDAALQACGSGLLHGIVEYHSLSDADETAAEELEGICGVFEGDIRQDCIHSAGHALIYDLPGTYGRALEVCSRAFAESSRTCEIGVLMMIRDDITRRITSGELPAPATAVSFDGYAKECLKLPERYHTDCVRGFSLIAFEADPTLLPVYFSWCGEKFPDALTSCEQDGGVLLGINNSSDPGPVLELCDDRAECVVSIAVGLKDFLGADQAETNVCTAIRRDYPTRATAWCSLITTRLRETSSRN